MELKAGDVFTWENYPFYADREKPRRWFIFLGRNKLNALVYHATATTQLQYYEKGARRAGHNFFKLAAGAAGLSSDSIIDLTHFADMPEADFIKYISDIQKKGTLKQDDVNRLVKCIKIDGAISGIIKKDVYRYLRDAKFTVNA
jgi:hypothetical protein